jgi:hypothetical protein
VAHCDPVPLHWCPPLLDMACAYHRDSLEV